MENEMIGDLVFVGVPIDVIITSGITTENPVQFTATKGQIIIESIPNSECMCNECRGKYAGTDNKKEVRKCDYDV